MPSSSRTPSQASESPSRLRLQEAIEHAAHLLPSQGPITVFIHHNTLHALEDLPFEDAVKKGAEVFGCQPYLSEDRYRQELLRGRIRFGDLWEVLREDLRDAGEEKVVDLCSRLNLRLAMLQYPLRTGPTEELIWFVAETDALRRFRSGVSSAVREQMIAETRHWVLRDLRNLNSQEPSCGRRPASRFPDFLRGIFDRLDEATLESWNDAEWEEFTLRALWAICCQGVADKASFAPADPSPIRHGDLLREATGADADLLVHDELIRFCAAFVDQGLARWELPRREEGFLAAFSALYRLRGGPHERWRSELREELCRLDAQEIAPLESIHESLALLGVSESEQYDFVAATLLVLRGWAGILHQLDVRGDRVVRPAPPGTLVEYLAVRLLLDRFALAETARQALGFTGPVSELRAEIHRRLAPPHPPAAEPRAFLIFQLAQMLGWTPERLHRLGKADWETLLREIETFSAWERRRVFHFAYEQRFYRRTLDAVALHGVQPSPSPACPSFQAVFCIDEREESLRRHLEEIAPDVETFSLAGFFFVPMYFRGVEDAHFVPLCPAGIRPQHWVAEEVVDPLQEAHQRRIRARRFLGLASHQIHLGSRTFAVGALLAAIVGVLASIPLIARVFAPRWTSRLRHKLGRFLQAPPLTRLQLERRGDGAGHAHGSLGFSLEEMTSIGERVLRDIGLTKNYSRLVLLLGHGSTSLNNPHESAHDCGACGGARGGPNARAIAQILNDPRIRERLAQRGIAIPPETYFVGGMHNTSNENVVFLDLDQLSQSHAREFASVLALVEQACERNAHERCRRFASAPLDLSPAGARQHVEDRAEDLAQVRPEWGHATNAVSIVGRRASTRGLFLDRRAFLTSYDPAQDDAEYTILTRILRAVFPVCAGINLEYYFSYIDNSGWGCGTKLPHNIAALVGVMDGAASDLRTGLPWQMVEIHEPVRLLNIVESTPEAVLRILEVNEDIGKLCRNNWVRLAVLHRTTRELSLYQNRRFQKYHPQATSLPEAASSADWYRGWRDHLEFAHIKAQETARPREEELHHA
ncbi:MAG TPA: DUF2309 domain-containing protein [Gemmataceae bacterium]|nr:DUF2309 domain-containing protein [Gemmataceae bacterium]